MKNTFIIAGTRPRKIGNQIGSKRALVLGGGGTAGNAWEIGVIAGLFDAGLDVTAADLIIGTSAGATTAAQVTSATPTKLFADILSAMIPPRTAPVGSGAGHAPSRPATNPMERRKAIIAVSKDAADMRRKLGASALEMEAASDGSWQTRWHDTVASRLPSQHWPQQLVQITALNARTGEPVVFDRHSGVDLADAVAASCSSGLPYRIGDNLYIDGAFRSSAENADLAAGYTRVLLLSPFSGRTLAPLGWGTHLAAQVDELRAHGSQVETIFPDNNSQSALGVGMSVMDPSKRRPTAQAGYDQGKALAARLTEFWR